MDMLDQALDPSQEHKGGQDTDEQIQTDGGDQVGGSDDQTAAAIASVTGQVPTNLGDPSNIQYRFHTDGNGQSQVTYRVVQVEGDASAGNPAVNVVTTSSFPQGQQTVTQVNEGVIPSSYSNGNSPSNDNQAGETRFTYFPAQSSDTAAVAQSEGSLTQAGAAGGQFYVMMSPQDVLSSGAQRSIAPRTHQFSPGKIDGTRTARDERRRATHNEVERRRRDKINNWIVKLSKLVPECGQDHSKQGQVGGSKGGILAKTCDYIHELRTANGRMAESLKETERLSVDAEILRQQVEDYKQENALLRAQLQQHGIEAVVPNTS